MYKSLNIDSQAVYTKKYSFFTLVTRLGEYEKMVSSAKQAGFDGSDIEFVMLDNVSCNQFDGFSGLNKAIQLAQGEYLIFCHQDILFEFDGRRVLDQCIADLEAQDQNWAVLGNAGKTSRGALALRISDPHGENTSIGNFPAEVISIDENFLIINQNLHLSASHHMFGFHLYGLDICQNALDLGYKNYVINFHLRHKSGGKIDESFKQAKVRYADLMYEKKNRNFYTTTCTEFYVSGSRLWNYLMQMRHVYQRYKKRHGFE